MTKDPRDPIIPVRYTPDESALIDAIRENLGVTTRAEALRVVLRHYVRANGIEATDPKDPQRVQIRDAVGYTSNGQRAKRIKQTPKPKASRK
jgi:hypothetical protein